MPIPRSDTAGLGVVLYLAGVALFALNDALGKWLVADYGVGQLMLLRSIGAGVVLAPLIVSLRIKFIDLRRPGLQALRVLCAATDTFAFYYATRYMPLADVMTFYMATPLIVTALSAPLLGEKVERFRWIAVWIGFVGVLQAQGTVAAPIRPLPMNCQKTNGSQWTPRSSRVIVWLSAKVVAPNKASGAAQENICGDGLSAISTPTKPTSTAIHRNRSTFSPRSGAESAVTIRGVAI